MRVPPSTSPGRSPSAIATTTAAWWCGWAFAPREYNGLLRRPPLLFWLLPQLDSAHTSTPARPQPAAGRETASRQRPAPNRRSGCRRGAFAPYALRLSRTAAFKRKRVHTAARGRCEKLPASMGDCLSSCFGGSRGGSSSEQLQDSAARQRAADAAAARQAAFDNSAAGKAAKSQAAKDAREKSAAQRAGSSGGSAAVHDAALSGYD